MSTVPCHHVYILQSLSNRSKTYKGYTGKNVLDRLQEHNNGQCAYTSRFMPWQLKFYCAFEDKYTALEFEKYLKSASGIAFSRKRFLNIPNKEERK
ncbi:MAG: GIY-YIG nuclease family protein [Parcubacteria group bacterium]